MSSVRVLAGILLGFVLAVPCGLCIGLSKKCPIFFTDLELFRPIPLIAYLPIALLLFKTIEESIIFKVYLPAIAPEVFTGLTVGTGASWMGGITGEMVSGQTGIGYSTWQAYQLLDYSQSIIGMFTIGLLGFVFSWFVRFTERRMIRWN